MTSAPATTDVTLDGVPVTPGLAVWDYNLRPTRVLKPCSHTPGWWDTANGGMFNGERMWTRHPATGQPAAEALPANEPSAASSTFYSGSEFTAAWNEMREQTGEKRLTGVVLERQMANHPWQKIASGTRQQLADTVRGLDRAPIPGHYRLARY